MSDVFKDSKYNLWNSVHFFFLISGESLRLHACALEEFESISGDVGLLALRDSDDPQTCSGLLSSVDLSRCVEMCRDVLSFVELCRVLSSFGELSQVLPSFVMLFSSSVERCQVFPSSVKLYRALSSFVELCRATRVFVKVCRALSSYV